MTTNNLILIKGGSHNDIKKALRQWIDLYSDDLIPDMTFELYENGKANHILKVDDRLETESFYYLVNYLNYPEGIDYKINIEGFTTAKSIRKKQKDLVNKKLLVYISNKDTEGDNVNVVTEDNETYKIDFGGKITKVNESKRYLIPNFEINSIAEVLRFDKKENQKKKSEKSKANFEKRLKIISRIAFSLFVLSLLTLLIDKKVFVDSTWFFGMLLGVWFLMDYEMLRVDKYFFYCLLSSLIFVVYGFIIKSIFSIHGIDKLIFGTFYPISILVVQRPVRLIYKWIFNREPVFDKSPPTYWDIVYTVILIFTFLLLPILMMDLIK